MKKNTKKEIAWLEAWKNRVLKDVPPVTEEEAEVAKEIMKNQPLKDKEKK